ncbi:HRDC-like protein [Tribonema minus]|uniref:HRDC-like protein n=1 Tax=Tribonema minus TaxID=303371 RepID=A0A835YSR6_9STRA|nr:HRDC-like protein [Tribonema minus]
MFQDDLLETENVNTLKFGPGFEEIQCLTHTEVYQILTSKTHDVQRTQAYTKTIEHVKRFGTADDEKHAITTELRQALETFERDTDQGTETLHSYEIVSLCNLMQADSTVDEAIALIPSLSRKFKEEDIEALLDIIRKANAAR